MRRLLLLRHAKAAAYSGGGDAERPLTERGRGDAGLIGRFIAAQGLSPDLAAASSAKRTRETLDCVIAELAARPPVLIEPALYLAEPETLLAQLRRTPNSVGTLLAIGHNPGVAELAHALTGSGERDARLRIEQKYPTAGLSVLEFDLEDWRKASPRSGKLVRFVTPRELRDGPFAAD